MFADAVEKYAPLNKGHITTRQNFQFHHIPLRDAAKFIREISDAGLSSREGCGNTVRNVTGDPWAGVCEELFDTDALRRRLRPLLRAPPHDAAHAAQGQDGLHRRPTRTARSPASTTSPSSPASATASAGFEVRVGGGTSIMPRIAPTLYDFVEADDGEYLKIAEAVFRIFDRQDWLRVNRARARIKVFVDKFGIDELRKQVEEELKGDWVDERDFTPDLLRPRRGGRRCRRRARPTRRPTATCREFERFAQSSVTPAEAGRLQRGPGPRLPRRPDARSSSAASRRSCATTAAATPGRPCTRTSCCAGCPNDAVYEVWTSAARARPRRARRRRDQRRRQLPGHRLVQARHHQLDGPQRAPSASAWPRWTITRPADAEDPHQDVRLPERLLAAPHREHRVLRRVDQGRRAHDPRVRRARRRHLRRAATSATARA